MFYVRTRLPCKISCLVVRSQEDRSSANDATNRATRTQVMVVSLMGVASTPTYTRSPSSQLRSQRRACVRVRLRCDSYLFHIPFARSHSAEAEFRTTLHPTKCNP